MLNCNGDKFEGLRPPSSCSVGKGCEDFSAFSGRRYPTLSLTFVLRQMPCNRGRDTYAVETSIEKLPGRIETGRAHIPEFNLWPETERGPPACRLNGASRTMASISS